METDEEYDRLSREQRLKAAVHYTVGQICKEVAEENEVTFTRQFIAVLAESTFKFSKTMALDLELFAKHAKRSTVNTDDVKMVVRKSPGLLDHIKDLCDQQVVLNEGKKKPKKRTKKPAAATLDDESTVDND